MSSVSKEYYKTSVVTHIVMNRLNQHALEEYERLRNESKLEPMPSIHLSCTSSILCLLNTRSLSKHATDIKCDMVLLQSDIIRLTETRLLPGQCTTSIIARINFQKISRE